MRILLALSVLTLALAGCSGDGGSDDGSDDFVTPPQDDQGRYVIEMGGDHGNRFSPAEAEVPVGATVVWVNNGGSHNVKSDDDAFPASSVSGDTGEHHEVTFDEEGTFEYHCNPHESLGMVGTLRVA